MPGNHECHDSVWTPSDGIGLPLNGARVLTVRITGGRITTNILTRLRLCGVEEWV